MNRFAFTFAKNATANIVRGGASAIVAIALPHFLTRALDHDRFAAWALMLQIAAYANYLDFGIQTAVARYLAQAIERGDDAQRDRLISTAFGMLAAAGMLAFIVIGVFVLVLPRLFHGIPISLVGESRAGMLVLAASAALTLPMSTFTGALVGLHRNEYPAMAIGGSRILGALAVLVTVHYTNSLLWLALCLGLSNLLGGVVQYIILKRLLPGIQLHLRYLSSHTAQELVRFCLGLTVFSLSMLVVSGLDVTIVGHFTFTAVGYYALAATLITFVAGLSNSIFSAMMTPVAVLQERRELGRIRDIVIRTTRLSSYASLVITLPVFVYGAAALRMWVGPVYAAQALPILEVLLVAQAVRLTGNSYCAMLIATGQQKYGVAEALIEAFTNLVFSIGGVVWLGPIGVAWGTLVGALAGVLCIFTFTMRWAREVPIPRWLFFREGILRPLLIAAPVLLYLLLRSTQNSFPKSLGTLTLATIVSVALALAYAKLPGAILQKRLAERIR